MDYKLALALKRAGFPQGEKSERYIYPQEGVIGMGGEAVYIPSLEELIDECGDEFHNLSRFDKDWMVNFRMLKGDLGQSEWDSQGKTPKEAVAKLYLKLNK